MATIRLTKKFTFEMAHALVGYDGKCRYIHGHSYTLHVTVKGEPEADANNPKQGMVMDFSELKNIINKLVIERFDHALLLRFDAPLADELEKAYDKVIKVSYQPTCENIVTDIAEELQAALPETISLCKIKLHETATSYAEWVAQEN